MTPKTRASDAFSEGKTPHFEESARESLADTQLRRNLGKATQSIRRRRSSAVAEMPAWEELEREGIRAFETDLAELIIQLADETSSHILVPAIHKNRSEIRELFLRELAVEELSDDPPDLTNVARLYLREKFLKAEVGVSGANFAVAETGTVCV